MPTKTRLRIVGLIGGLQSNPRPVNAVKLTNREEYKLRSGNYRILYVIDDELRLVEVRKVRHRGEAYRN